MENNFITNNEIEQALIGIYKYLVNHDIDALKEVQPQIKKTRDIDFQIKTLAEYNENNGSSIIQNSHGPTRMLILGPLSLLGELYFHNGLLTIYDDDPIKKTYSHINTYRLTLKDLDTHLNVYIGNPTAEDEPYDFNTQFIKQLTQYPDKVDDTTKTAFDSFFGFYKKKNGYSIPFRKLDFKSALWNTSKMQNCHNVDYILRITQDKTIYLFNRRTRDQKHFEFKPASGADKYLDKYIRYLNVVDVFKGHSWDEFIID